MNLKKLYSRLSDKLPSLKLGNGKNGPMFPILASLDEDCRWLYERSAGLPINKSLKALRENSFCKNCRFNLAKHSVCNSCLRTSEGRAFAIRLREALKEARSLEKYGVTNPLRLEATTTKRIQTLETKYGKGVTCPSKSPIVVEKTRNTFLKRYGETCALRVPRFKAKVQASFIRNLGVENPSHSPEVLEKIRLSARSRKTINVLGVDHVVQGYEPRILELLERNSVLRWVTTSLSEMPEIWYKDPSGKRRRYFPDFVFESSKTGHLHIVEVKSVWTLTASGVSEKAKAARKFCRQSSGLFSYAIAVPMKDRTLWIRTSRQLLTSINKYRNRTT